MRMWQERLRMHQSFDDRGEFHPVVGGGQVAAVQFARVIAPSTGPQPPGPGLPLHSVGVR